MANYALTFDYQIPSVREPGFFRRYESLEIARNLNGVNDTVSNRAIWADRDKYVLMLKPEQLEQNWLNSAAQIPYIIRLTDMQAVAANLSNNLVFEANVQQNPNNPWIHHSPATPFAPSPLVNAPEQIPGLAQLDNVAQEAQSVTGFPSEFPGAAGSDVNVICWTKAKLPGNMPLYLRWFVMPSSVGHKTVYNFCIGQYCVQVGPSAVEVFRDISQMGNRSVWESTFRADLFGPGPIQTTGWFSNVSNQFVNEYQGHPRGLLWLPYARNFVYLESSYGKHGVFQSHPFALGAGGEWDIVESRNMVVAALTPGPGYFQIQKVKFADGPGVFNLPPFTTDYAPSGTPAANWLVDEFDAPHGSSVSHTTPSAAYAYTYTVNTIDGDCPTVTTTSDASDQARTFGAVYTLTPGTDPSAPALKTYTPQLYGIDVRLQNVTQAWPVAALSITDVSQAAPSARIQRARLDVQVGDPGRFTAEVLDLGVSLATKYARSYFPLRFSDQNGVPGDPAAWTTLWLGVADPVETTEMRLDTTAPRALRVKGTDFWKWLNDSPMRDNRDWTGFGHIYVIQSVLQQAGISIANWDGPAPGTVNGAGKFVPDTAGNDSPLGGIKLDDPTLADGTAIASSQSPLKPAWRPNRNPPDSYGSYIQRIVERFSAWDFGFHADGTVYYHPYGFHDAVTPTVFFKNRGAHPTGPTYFLGSVEYRNIEPDANVVQAVSAGQSGATRFSTLWVDFGSLYSASAPNFIGKPKFYIFALPGLLSCNALNLSARNVFMRARLRRQLVKFRGDYLPGLKVGYPFQLEGESGTYRLTGVSASYDRPKWNTANYEGWLIETGHL